MIDSVGLNLDSDGFLSQQCPSCRKRFKIKPGVGAAGPLQYCPYCDFSGRDCWWTEQQAKHLRLAVTASVHEDLTKMFQNSFKGSSSIKFTAGPKQETPSAPAELDEDWPIVEFPSTERIKHDGSQDRLRCPVTGTEFTL